MAKNYSIIFRSLRGGTMYVVSIEGGTGDPVPLKGGLSPFTTEEDNSEDAFEAVRTSSGYIRIVNDGKDANGNAFDWRDIIPATDLSRPVTLRNGQGTTLWVGFMQAQNFGNVLYGDPQELEFPIQCCIAALNSQQVTTNPTQLHNFAYLLYNFFITQFASIPSHGFANFVIQGGNDARAWLLQRIDWQNFLRENEENDLESAYSKGQVLGMDSAHEGEHGVSNHDGRQSGADTSDTHSRAASDSRWRCKRWHSDERRLCHCLGR